MVPNILKVFSLDPMSCAASLTAMRLSPILCLVLVLAVPIAAVSPAG